MDVLIREVSNAGGGLLRSETWIREGLAFFGAVIGAVWGYSLGRSIERRRWRTSLQPALEAFGASVKSIETIIDRLVESTG